MSAIAISQNIDISPDTKIKEALLTFTNSTDNFIILATWQVGDYGLVMYNRFFIEPNTTVPLPASSTGEFIVDSEEYERLGKFRLKSTGCTKPYSWMESDSHNITRHVSGSCSNHELINMNL